MSCASRPREIEAPSWVSVASPLESIPSPEENVTSVSVLSGDRPSVGRLQGGVDGGPARGRRSIGGLDRTGAYRRAERPVGVLEDLSGRRPLIVQRNGIALATRRRPCLHLLETS